MASIVKRKGRKKPYMVFYRDTYERQHAKSFETRKEAVEYRGQVETKRPQGTSAKVTMVHALDTFIEDRTATRRENTVRSYKSTLGIFQQFAHIDKVTSVKPVHVERFRNTQRKKGLEPKTVDNQLKQISAFFNWCVARDWLTENPASPKKVTRPKWKRKIPKWLDEEEVETLLQDVRENCNDPQIIIAVVLAARAGLRLGEIAGLKWSDVRYDESVLTIEEGKSAQPRIVPMHDDVRAVLESIPVVGDHVLPVVRRTNNGDHLNGHRFGQRVRGWLHAHGYPIGVHTLRHSFASALVRVGATEEELREILGHVSADTTRMYIHSRPGHRQALVARLGKTDTEPDLSVMEA